MANAPYLPCIGSHSIVTFKNIYTNERVKFTRESTSIIIMDRWYDEETKKAVKESFAKQGTYLTDELMSVPSKHIDKGRINAVIKAYLDSENWTAESYEEINI